MLNVIFSFRGRLNRLQYFASVVGLVIATMVLMMMVVLATGLRPGMDPRHFPVLGALAILACAVVFVWISFALQARRIRDIGLDPLYVIPALIAVAIVDRIVAGLAPALSMGALHQQTLIGLLINLGSGLALLFWPGRSGGGPAPTASSGWLAPAKAVPAAAVDAPAAPPRPANPFDAMRPRTTFGRRGL